MQFSSNITAFLLAAFALTGAAVGGVQYLESAVSADADFSDPCSFRYRIDMNNAPEAELMLLSGVGSTRANMIIEHRAVRPLTCPDDMKEIRYPSGKPVFNQRVIDGLRDHVSFTARRRSRVTP